MDCTNVILKALDSNCLAPSDLVPSSQKPVPKYDLLKSLTSQKGKITKGQYLLMYSLLWYMIYVTNKRKSTRENTSVKVVHDW